MNIRGTTLTLVLLIAAAFGCKPNAESSAPTATSASAAASPDRVPPGVTAVQNEMRLLHEAMRDSVTAIANGTLGAIPEGLHRVHRARELTERAIETGQYKLPKNAGDIAAFNALDEAFHGELEKLVEKAKANDATATSAQLGVVLSKCGGCHTQFRP